MKLLPLQQVSSQLRAGAELPWGVRDATGKLLLARGQLVHSEQMVAALLERGMFVDAEEAKALRAEAAAASAKAPENYFGRWQALHGKLAVLRHPDQSDLIERLRECVAPIAALAERNPDLLIFLIVRHDHNGHGAYGIAHALHVASVCSLLAHRLGWPEERHDRAIVAALTMNLSIIDLQGRLADQADPLSVAQREAIRGHPQAAVQLLRAAGVDDGEWLSAVEQHHEQPGGGGYPGSIADPTEMAKLLRFVDAFVAMHSTRAGRGALPAQRVARELYTQSAANPLAALVIKEFGIYPPGCYVRLASGETAVVVRRSADAAKPHVAALLNRNGDPMAAPARRDTAQAGYAIVESVPEKAIRVRVPAEAFFASELKP